ncbi:SCO4225 family membrane protein [Nonomuraea terrae]|uniref:SCO4225 family membrane protein n=1 Tax=Nonomuraea terrae TaxID=2530383 RepID=UPI0037947B62
MTRYRNGRVAAVLAGVYASLVVLLGVVSVVILLTVSDPILLSGVALMLLTFPLGPLIWWGWAAVPPQMADPVLLTVILTAAGLLQSYLIWRISRGPAIPQDGAA